MKDKYLAKRKQLEQEAQNHLNTGNVIEANNKITEIENLDTEYEAQAKAQANLNTLLANNGVIPPMVAISNGILDTENKNLTEEELKAKEEKTYANAWAKDMLNRALTQDEAEVFNKVNSINSTNSMTTKSHEILVPETVAKGIWREAGELFPLFGEVAPTFITGGVTIIKEKDTGADAEWYDEETEVGSGTVDFGEINLTGCELAKSVKLSWKLKNMSIQEFIPYITTVLAEKMGKALATAIVLGKGKPSGEDTFKPQPRGIHTALVAEAGTPQIVKYTGNITYANITTVMSKIKKYGTGAKFYANSNTIWSQLANIVDGNGKAQFIADVTAGGVARLFGKVVVEDDSMADGEVLLGDIKRGYKMNVNQGVTLYSESQMKKRINEYMSYAIVDGDLMTTKAFVYLKK